MIVVRSPLRISFVGGSTDLPAFYTRHPGRVISATIDKYVYLVVNPTPLIDKVSVRYSKTETVDHPSELEHTRVKAALLDLGIHKNIEIASFASLPARTGLGSSSSFSVALMKALYALRGRHLSPHEVAQAAVRLELELLQEPIGKQDQYAAAFGGLNIFNFNKDGTVQVEPVILDYKIVSDLEHHMLVFYSGVTRDASKILSEQNRNLNSDEKKFETMKKMASQVDVFVDKLKAGDLPGLGALLHEGWLMKRSLASTIPNDVINSLYEAGMSAGAWGGKLLGAGGGGCVMFLAPMDAREEIRRAVFTKAAAMNLTDYKEIPVRFSSYGCEIQFRSDHGF
mgnify:CR=1 FL=1